MKIKRIKITNLFGYLNPDIDMNSSIKIIYGKNGTGKTTILKIINSILKGLLYELIAIKFQKLSCYFDDGTELLISKANDNKTPVTRRNQLDKKNLLLSLLKDGVETETGFFAYKNDFDISFGVESIVREIPELDRIGQQLWRNMETGEMMDINDIIDVYGGQFSWLGSVYQKAWYKNIINNFDVKFIQTQRLITYSNKPERSRIVHRDNRFAYESTVAKYSVELKNYVRDKLSEAALIGQKLDSTFPKRLLDKTIPIEYSEEIIVKLANKIDMLRTNLELSGLVAQIDVIKIEEGSMSDVDQRAIYLYLTDSLKKYEVFEDLEKRISLFTEILNKKFNGNKSIAFSKENGIQVFTKNKENLNPRLLSSGEQHEIILLYDLIFNATKNMLVLIDEPEISLHIDWQLEFISDLESIAKINNPQFLIATHSPAIIGKRIKISQEIVE